VNFLQQKGFCHEQFTHLQTTTERCDKLIKHPPSQILMIWHHFVCINIHIVKIAQLCMFLQGINFIQHLVVVPWLSWFRDLPLLLHPSVLSPNYSEENDVDDGCMVGLLKEQNLSFLHGCKYCHFFYIHDHEFFSQCAISHHFKFLKQ
jgi:hypothetical protein